MAALSSGSVFSFDKAVRAIQNGLPLPQATERLLQELTTEERLSLLDGDVPFWEGLATILYDRYNRNPFVHGEVPRLQIPGIRFTDGPRGVVMGASTAFPVSMARAATWDVSLEEKVGNAIGLEGKAQGANYYAGVCINLPRHPAWGRIQETYSEDPLLLGDFGAALTRGVQRHIMACVKHFALNSMENARFSVDVIADDATLHEVYLPHFRRVVEEGVASVMSSYNSVNGEWAGQNKTLLTDILREQWGFDGFVISDFIFGLRDPHLSLENGLDLEAPFAQQRAMHLRDALERGTLKMAHVDRACTRILGKQLEFAVKTSRDRPLESVVFCQQHRDLSREVAGRSVVLLKNEDVKGQPLLPLDVKKISRCAVIGRLANTPNTGDRGSSAVYCPEVVTPYEGIKQALPQAEVILDDSDRVERAALLASKVDVVVVVSGYDATDEGEYVVPSIQQEPSLVKLFPPADTEPARQLLALIKGEATTTQPQGSRDGLVVGAGGDRESLRLRKRDVDIINAVVKANPRTIVSVVAAGPVITEEWRHDVPAVLMSWYSGCEGGRALADVLLGRVDASGRLPFSIPKDEAHLPWFDKNATKIAYDRWHGQSLLDRLGVEAAFPLGYGLSYTRFTFSDLSVKGSEQPESLSVSVMISNIGARSGRCIPQVYGLPGLQNLPLRILLGYTTVIVDSGQSKKIQISASLRPLQRWSDGQFVLATSSVVLEVGAYAGDPNCLRRLEELDL